MSQVKISGLGLSLEPRNRGDAFAKLGGIKVYAPSDKQLQEEMKRAGDVINSSARQQLCTSKPYLTKLLRESLGVGNLERRLINALIGWQLRLGQLDSTLCESAANKAFWILVHREQLERFTQCLELAEGLLHRAKSIAVRDLESKFFGHRAPGTWSSAFYVFARLAYLGRAEYVDNSTFRTPEGLQDAFREAAE